MRGGLPQPHKHLRFTGICLNYSKQAKENEVIVMVCLMEGGQTMAVLMDGRWTKPGVRDSWFRGLERTRSLPGPLPLGRFVFPQRSRAR